MKLFGRSFIRALKKGVPNESTTLICQHICMFSNKEEFVIKTFAINFLNTLGILTRFDY